MASKPAKLLATGGIRTVDGHVQRPVVHIFFASFNSGKATMCLQISQKADDHEVKHVLHMRDNYKPGYARLNPDTMAVPTMQIDDKVCTDSYDMCMYLMERYPGPGDQEVVRAGRKQEFVTFIKQVAAWDEYMFTYGSLPQDFVDLPNNIRLANLRYYLNEVLQEEPDDMGMLVEAYVRKIANVTCMKRGMQMGEQKEKDLEENRAVLDGILARANELAGQHPDGFLFGDQLTTADAFLLPIFRIFKTLRTDMFEATFQTNPHLRGYWERAEQHPDVWEGLMKYVAKRNQVCYMLSLGIPKTILAYKLGLLKAPELPEEIEERIGKATEELWQRARPN